MDGGVSSGLAVVPAIWASPNGKNSRRIWRLVDGILLSSDACGEKIELTNVS